MPPPGGGGKRGRDTKVSLPLLTPQPFLRTRLPPVARLKARGPQGRLVRQGATLDRSGAFRSGMLPPCTGWPRTVMRGKPRKENSGHNSVPKSARRTEPSPAPPFRCTSPMCQRKGGFGGVKRGQGNHTVPLPPFVLAGEYRHSRPPKAATLRALRQGVFRFQRRTAVSAENFASALRKGLF